jgi:hypothetical protein
MAMFFVEISVKKDAPPPRMATAASDKIAKGFPRSLLFLFF